MVAVLLIEDDDDIGCQVESELSERGFDLTRARDGVSALRQLMVRVPDIVLLDLGLPDVDGSRVLSMVRAMSTVAVIVVTARGEDEEIVRLLDLGADDYVVKPFTVNQLEARIRAVLRRLKPSVPEIVTVGGLRVDSASRSASLDGADLSLSPREFQLLAFLAHHAGTTVTRSDILASVWGPEHTDAEASLDVHLSWLRAKLGESARRPRYLQRVRGVGIRLQSPGA